MDLRSEWRGGVFGYIRPNGSFMPLIAGGADDEEKETEETEDDDDEDEEDSDKTSDEDIKDPKAYAASQKAAADRLARKLKRAEKERKAALDKVKEFEDANKTDQDKISDAAKEAEARVTQLEQELQDSRTEAKLLSTDDIVKLPAVRRKLVVRAIVDEIEVDEDGDNIQELIDDLKKEDPDLFNVAGQSSSDDDTDDDDDTDAAATGGRTAPPPKKKKDSTANTDRAALEKRFPALMKHRPS